MSNARQNVDKLNDIVSVTDYGAKGDGVTADQAAIQAAINAVSTAGGGTVRIPAGVYAVTGSIEPKSNVTLLGDGAASVLKINSASAFEILHKTSGPLTNFVVDNLRFDGSLNYPANSDVYKQTYALRNTAIKIDVTCSFVTIRNCSFFKLSTASIDFNAFSSSDLVITDNTFNFGSYIFKVAGVRIPASSPSSDAERPRRIVMSRNVSVISGPQYHYDASKEDWVASADGYNIDSVMDAVISDNVITLCGGTGIRVEDSLRVTVVGNVVDEPGQDGIAIYKNNIDCVVANNTVKNWGRIPFAYGIRNYSGTYVVAREFPRALGPALPADPTAPGPTQYFVTWPYTLTNINTATIIAYSNTDYYVTENVGILPFRGYSAIGVTSLSERVSVVGNVCLGNLTQSGGQYVYAGDYGVSPVHPVNSSASVSDNARNSTILANIITDARLYRIYHPLYQDPIAALGLLGRAQYIGNRDEGSLIADPQVRISDAGTAWLTGIQFPATQVASADPNQLDDYEEGTFEPVLTFDNASAGITYASRSGRYVKVGKMVQVQGEITLTSKGSSTGIARISSLPFFAAGLTNELIPVTIGRYVNITGAAGNPLNCIIDPGEGRFALGFQTNDAGRVNMLDTAFANDSAISFSVVYRIV